jgi:hypothetical protein
VLISAKHLSKLQTRKWLIHTDAIKDHSPPPIYGIFKKARSGSLKEEHWDFKKATNHMRTVFT